MESEDLLRRLEQRENELRVRIDHLRKELEDLETSVTRIMIAREEVLALGTFDHFDEADEPTELARSEGRYPKVGPVSDQIVMILASSNRAWRADEMTDALGLSRGKGRTRVESTRQKLDRLVELGIARVIRPGLYAIATATTAEEA